MYKNRLTLCLLVFALAVFATSCADEDPMTSQEKLENDYLVNWIKTFGLIDPDQDWNMATSVTVTIDHHILRAGGRAELYTSNPMGGGRYLGALTDGYTSANVDVVNGAKSLYVKIKDNEGQFLYSTYLDIIDGAANFYDARSRSIDCSVTVKETFTATRRVGDSSYSLDEAKKVGDTDYWEQVDGVWTNCEGETSTTQPSGDGVYTQWNKQRLLKQTFATLDGNSTTTVKEVQIKDMVPIVGKGGKFEEIHNNRKDYWNIFDRDVIFKGTGDPISVTYQFGGTAYSNVFGYYYWEDDEDPIAATKYILMEDGRPQENVFLNEANNKVESGMAWPGLVSGASSETLENYMVGTKYNLVYFDNQGAHYEFPEDINVAFFMISGQKSTGNTNDGFPETSKYVEYMFSSVSDHNKSLFQNFTQAQNSPDANGSYTDLSYDGGEVSAVTYKANGTVVLGFEDGTDKDMNDILMFVNGVDAEEIPEVIAETPVTNSWLIACEDLGSTGDYDFNDIVFSVSHEVGAENITITPLAAGGIYAANIFYKNENLGEIHKLLNGTEAANGSYPLLNTSSYQKSETTITKTLTGTDFSITNLEDFSIVVTGKDGTITINAPTTGTAPQMMCLPGTWKWPKEYLDIRNAYPGFADWSENSTTTDWINNVSSDAVINWY